MYVAVAVAVAWYAFLSSLILLADTPVTVNYRQIEESPLVVSGTVAADGTVTVQQVFKGATPSDGLRLALPLAFPAGDWILPLFRAGKRFEVTPTRLPNQTRLVYPVTDDALVQIAAMVE